jgi:hypothetical protein
VVTVVTVVVPPQEVRAVVVAVQGAVVVGYLFNMEP